MFFSKYIQWAKNIVSFGKEVATGNDGMGSASRVVALLVTIVVLGVLITHVVLKRGLPDASQLYGLSALEATGLGAYATNKIRRDQNGGDPSPPPQVNNNGN